MKDPNIKVEIKHSQSKNAWNVIGTIPGCKYKIARVPYHQDSKEGMEMYNTRQKNEALEHAEFICFCFNKSKQIVGGIF